MPEEIVTRILRLPGYRVSAWEADEATNTLTLAIRQTARAPFYVCRGCGITEELRVSARQFGAVAVLEKPVGLDKLVNTVAAAA